MSNQIEKGQELYGEELAPYGLKVSGASYDADKRKLLTITTNLFPVKGSKKMVKELETKGYYNLYRKVKRMGGYYMNLSKEVPPGTKY